MSDVREDPYDPRGVLDGYLPRAQPPAPVRALRILLYVAAGLTVVVVLLGLLIEPLSGASIGAAVWAVWPGIAAFLLAGRLDRPSRRIYWLVVALGVVYVLLSLAAIGQGSPRGITNLILPTAILILVNRASSRAFLKQSR